MSDPGSKAPDGGGRSALDETIGSETLPDSVRCPFCRTFETEVFSPFGGQVSTSQYYCRSCRTVFDYLRWR